MAPFFLRDKPKISKVKVHPVELQDPTRVLNICFSPLFMIMVPLGVLPVKVNSEGWATFKILQPSFAFYLLFLGLFTTVTYIYAPFYISAMNQMGAAFVFEVAKYLFVCGQHFAAATTIVMVPFLTGRVTKLWNKLHQLVLQIILCHSSESFVHVYRLTRLVIVLWLVVVVSSWYLWWRSFFTQGLFQSYFHLNESSFNFYLHITGCIVLSTLISSHALHSIFFISLACTLRMCFRSITRAAAATEMKKCQQQTDIVPEQLIEKLNERKKVCLQLVEAHNRASALVAFLGNIYGRYMVVEMAAFFSGTLTSIFALLNNFQAIRLETVVITLLINIFWFCGVCECGQMLLNEEQRCYRSMKGIALRCAMSSNWMIDKFVGVKVTGLTAANYFTFSRELVTAAVVSLATYLIVMLQFNAADKTHNLIYEIRNLTYMTAQGIPP